VPSFGALDAGELATRRERALHGDITEGGVVDPREAAAFVYGYLKVRYSPARRAKGTSPEDLLAVGKVAAAFKLAADESTAAGALARALKIGDTPAVQQLVAAVSTVFDAAKTADPARAAAIQVLQHAAGVVSAARQPAAAEKFALAADSTTQAGSVLALVVDGVSDVIDDTTQKLTDAKTKAAMAIKAAKTAVGTGTTALKVEAAARVDDLAAGLNEAKKTLAGGLNVAVDAAGSLKDATVAELEVAKKAAGDLAATGLKSVQAKLAAVEALAAKLTKAGADARDALMAKLLAMRDSLAADLRTVAEKGSALQKALAEQIQTKFDAAVALADKARETVAKLPGMVAAAASSQVDKLEKALASKVTALEARVTDTVKALIADPCGTAAPAALQPQCRANMARLKAAAQDPCSILSGPARLLCQHPIAAPLIMLGGLIVGLGLLFLATRSSSAATPVTASVTA